MASQAQARTSVQSLFQSLTAGAVDPVLASIEAYAADPRPEKVNLGVGMYYDENGEIPLMAAVREAEQIIAKAGTPWGYIPVEGVAAFRKGVTEQLFGTASPAVAAGRVAVLQTLGGTGAIKVGAELIAQMDPAATVAVSDPTWVNHPQLFGSAGLASVYYPYVDAATGRLDFDGMTAALKRLPEGAVVVLQACCHNPTGIDPTPEQWQALVDLMRRGGLLPFIDLAYQGFAEGLEVDALPVRLLAESDLPFFVALSFSKSFALYGERVGALAVVTPTAADAERLMASAKNIIRAIYSTPPSHGAALVATIFGDARLREMWKQELEGMRLRIVAMRHALVDRLKGDNGIPDPSFILAQRGLFSFSGLTPPEMRRLQRDHAIHAVENGRLCMAAVNTHNVDRVAEALRAVMRDARAGAA